MTRNTRMGIGGARIRAVVGMLLAGAIGLTAFAVAPLRAGAADDGAEIADTGSAAAEGGIPTVAAAKRLLGIEAERTEGGTLLRLRADMTKRINEALPGSTGGVASAVITGKRRG